MKFGKSAYLVWFQHCSTGFSSGAYAGSHSNWNQSGCCASKYAAAERCALQAIPDQDHLAAIVIVQLPEQTDHVLCLDVLRLKREIQRQAMPKRRDADEADHRESIVAIPGILLRRLPGRRPGAATHRLEHEAAFIQENDGS